MSRFHPLANDAAPGFEVRVDGSLLPPVVRRQIDRVSVTEYADPPNQFQLRLHDPGLAVVDARTGLLAEGREVEVKLGYVGDFRSMIQGTIVSLWSEMPSGEAESLEVAGFDQLHRLTRGTTLRTFEGSEPNSGLADSEIVTRIAREMGLSPDIDETSERVEPRVQNNITNLAFVEQLARAHGFQLWADGKKLLFKRQRPCSDVTLIWGQTLLDFSPTLSTVGQVGAVVVRGWDPVQKKSFSHTSTRSQASEQMLSPSGQEQIQRGADGKSELLVTEATVTGIREAQELADSILGDQEETVVTADGRAAGHPEITAGTSLRLLGIGRFSGQYRVQRVTHSIDSHGYISTFQATKTNEADHLP